MPLPTDGVGVGRRHPSDGERRPPPSGHRLGVSDALGELTNGHESLPIGEVLDHLLLLLDELLGRADLGEVALELGGLDEEARFSLGDRGAWIGGRVIGFGGAGGGGSALALEDLLRFHSPAFVDRDVVFVVIVVVLGFRYVPFSIGGCHDWRRGREGSRKKEEESPSAGARVSAVSERSEIVYSESS